MSVTVGVPRDTVVSGPIAGNDIAIGGMSNGAVVSFTITENEAVAVFPAVSCALQDTFVVVRPNWEPDVGVHATGTVPSTRSLADTAYVTVAPNGPVASFVIVDGTVIVGAVVS